MFEKHSSIDTITKDDIHDPICLTHHKPREVDHANEFYRFSEMVKQKYNTIDEKEMIEMNFE